MGPKRRQIFLLAFVALFYPAVALAQPTPAEIKLHRSFGQMGLWATPINEEFAKKFCVTSDHGLLVVPVEHLGFFEPVPFELRPWDIVIKSGGKEVRGMSDLALAEGQKEVDLTVLRDGKLVNVKIPIIDMPRDMVIGSSLDEDEEEPSFPSHRDEIKEAVYHRRGESVWDERTLMKSGDGVIAGKLIISGDSVEGVEVSLFLAGNKRTQPATTDSDGRFEINVPPGKYQYIGYALAGPAKPKRNMVGVNRTLAPFRSMEPEMPREDCDELTERFNELESKYGPEQAAEMIAEEFEDDFEEPFMDKYPLNVVSHSTDTIPDIVYNKPIKIVAPRHNTRVSLDRLSFAWVPYEEADSYFVDVTHIRKEGTMTSYRSICSGTVSHNSLDASELECRKFGFMDDDVDDLISGERYGVKVYAYDEAGNLLSASSEHSYVQFFIK